MSLQKQLMLRGNLYASRLQIPETTKVFRYFRPLSTSTIKLFAQPTDTRTGYAHAPPSTSDHNPYKAGPSAIDKAVHLFFFTEIVRGVLLITFTE